MIKPFRVKAKMFDNTAKAGSVCNLGKKHHGKLVPSVEATIFSFGPVLFFDLAKIMSVNQL
jgi:hypothetical protein